MSNEYTASELVCTSSDEFSLAIKKLYSNEEKSYIKWSCHFSKKELIESLINSGDDDNLHINFFIGTKREVLDSLSEEGFLYPPVFQVCDEKSYKPLKFRKTGGFMEIKASQEEVDEAVKWAEAECTRMGWDK